MPTTGDVPLVKRSWHRDLNFHQSHNIGAPDPSATEHAGACLSPPTNTRLFIFSEVAPERSGERVRKREN